ncbi:hypothetical protein BSKO_00241 [Bryopsis sp. KO-2023]|nr:hypothetical protein BSKO_00241 [Bryopsis sp. KO-2023]
MFVGDLERSVDENLLFEVFSELQRLSRSCLTPRRGGDNKGLPKVVDSRTLHDAFEVFGKTSSDKVVCHRDTKRRTEKRLWIREFQGTPAARAIESMNGRTIIDGVVMFVAEAQKTSDSHKKLRERRDLDQCRSLAIRMSFRDFPTETTMARAGRMEGKAVENTKDEVRDGEINVADFSQGFRIFFIFQVIPQAACHQPSAPRMHPAPQFFPSHMTVAESLAAVPLEQRKIMPGERCMLSSGCTTSTGRRKITGMVLDLEQEDVVA